MAYEEAHAKVEQAQLNFAQIQNENSTRASEAAERRKNIELYEAKVKKTQEECKQMESKKIQAER